MTERHPHRSALMVGDTIFHSHDPHHEASEERSVDGDGELFDLCAGGKPAVVALHAVGTDEGVKDIDIVES